MSSTQPIISIKNIHAGYGSHEVLRGISLSVEVNQQWAVIGRNGTGKSTLVKLAAGILHPKQGSVLLNGIVIADYPAKKRARLIAYVPQKPEGVVPYTVEDFVMLGRYSLMGPLGLATSEDRDAVLEAMELCDIGHLQTRLMSTLSGGELQRVLLAGSVAQHTPVLLLDEPTTFLDPAHERLFFDALGRIQKTRELSTIMITHDINTALIHCSHLCALLDGQILFKGTTETFRSECPSILNKIFGVHFKEYASTEKGMHAFGAWGQTCHI